jgi:hypothetical protein
MTHSGRHAGPQGGCGLLLLLDFDQSDHLCGVEETAGAATHTDMTMSSQTRQGL